ncbi:2-oxoacid:acceptor oxidoreductase subunit alpha [Rubricoccus marinus]|uniref:2-oxoglutarate ferredoxin oxidoreductase subunit alpha n=1 Tax=Rubricoccus marinus TaxID=716817 RepID=A0A259U2I8_9BACT|nr:2-oxoacid:acceptor oxidoreductase subunit alpha [Rubricoccus marinus]OZC04057.1 2-oxoglutarate ferredoxin oxidoreductase subunit alpha [Rubricoccus marinus]
MSSTTTTVQVPEVTILFAGDSGDGMQLTGSQFTLATALARNDLATLPDFPAEIRAPAGTLYGVSGFQLHFGSGDIHTPGDEVDLLVAMNPAALHVNLHRVREGGAVLVNTSSFEARDLKLAGLDENPLENGSLDGYQLFEVELTRLTREALADTDLSLKEVDRCKNMFALGLALWMYTRPIDPAREWVRKKFAKVPEIRDANLTALEKGVHYGDITEAFANRYEVAPAELAPGTYRAIKGNDALALGLTAAGQKSGLGIFYATYPITPASDLLHALSRYKASGVKTFQAEDEIAAIGAAIGAAFGGNLGVTATSGPGMALKSEFMGLATMTELPLVIIDVQRAGPSTGMPTKTEQSDLMMAVYGRNGEAPTPVLAARTPGDCFEVAYNACRVAARFMTPVIVLSDGYLGNGSEPWRIPEASGLADFDVTFAEGDTAPKDENGALLPYARDEATLARPWARPGTKGLEHRIGGLEKDALTGGVSYDPENHQHMTDTRAEKLERLAAELAPVEVEGDQEGDVLVVAWGSTYGAVKAGVERAREQGVTAGHLHLRWLNPMPPALPETFAKYRRVLVPELNHGQLIRLLRERYLLDAVSLAKIQGLPFSAREIGAAVVELATSETPEAVA